MTLDTLTNAVPFSRVIHWLAQLTYHQPFRTARWQHQRVFKANGSMLTPQVHPLGCTVRWLKNPIQEVPNA